MASCGLEHLAIIMDGNGRWAEKRSSPRTFGHKKGAEALRSVVAGVLKQKIPYLTVYAFSYENWERPHEEVDFLMRLFSSYLDTEINELVDKGIKLKFIGELSLLAEGLQKKIVAAEQRTSHNSALTLCVAVSYSSRKEIVNAFIRARDAGVTDYNEQTIADYLYTSSIPDPDMIVRTGGEKRISNFLLWQCAYSELLFMDKYWPDFGEGDVVYIKNEYEKRNRRYGKV